MARVKTMVASAVPVRTTKVKLLKGVVLGPGQLGKVGEIYEIPRHIATQLISSGMAEETDEGDPVQHDETPADEKESFGVAIEKPTSRDPKPARRG